MTEQELWKESIKARKKSYSPYSKFAVGAALECDDGTVVLGCNIENASYGGTVCAERVAVLKAVSEGKKKFTRLAVAVGTEKPCVCCALCLQVLAEFCDPGLPIVIGSPKKITGRYKLKDLLPHPFGPKDLL